jgi:hypothetical protein
MQATTASSVLAFAVTTTVLGGCVSTPCSANVVPAILLTITGADDEVAQSAEITFENEQLGRPLTRSCGQQGNSCSEFRVGDSAGTYMISITAPDYEPLELTVEVDEDDEGCHPVTESVEVELVAAM